MQVIACAEKDRGHAHPGEEEVLCWHQFWSQHWFPGDIPCCGSGRNAKHTALTTREHHHSCRLSRLLLPALLPPPHEEENKVFFDDFRKRHSVFLDPQKHRTGFSTVSLKRRAMLPDPQQKNQCFQ